MERVPANEGPELYAAAGFPHKIHRFLASIQEGNWMTQRERGNRVRAPHPQWTVFLALTGLLAGAPALVLAQTRGESPDRAWRTLDPGAGRGATATAGAGFTLDAGQMSSTLASAPLESQVRLDDSATIVYLPLPTGGYASFRVVESNILDPGLAARFPEIKSYAGVGLDDPAATVRFGFSPRGIAGLILGNEYSVSITADGLDPAVHTSAYGAGTQDFSCGVSQQAAPSSATTPPAGAAVGSQLRVYRAAIATSADYLSDPALGNNDMGTAVASLNAWLNGINAIYERELAVRLTLVNNTSIIGLSAAQIDNSDEGVAINQIPPILGTLVGSANYDVGHVLITGGGGGIAGLGVVCNSTDTAAPSKGRAASAVGGPAGNSGTVGLLAHEFGHQFGAPHSFNGTQGACSGNRSSGAAFETGSGTTIMSYGGICDTDNIGGTEKTRFHNGSFRSIASYIASGGTCATPSATGNGVPTVGGGPDRVIPKGTPFALTATAADPDVADFAKLTYNWEQIDAGLAFPQNGTEASFKDAGDPANTTRPIFRPYPSSASPTRSFPSLTYILNNANVPPAQTGGLFTAESLPAVGRSLNFRVTVRDNRVSGAGVADDHVTLSVDGNAGPFLVTAPNTSAVTWTAGGNEVVTWSTANTNLAPVSAANVRIRLSVDDGQSFPYLLAASTPNDGSESVAVPAGLNTAGARVKVEAEGNVFFDISDASFTINSGAGCPAVASVASSAGPVGASVTLTGSGFTGVTGVSFNGVAATFVVASNSVITTTVPAGATSGPLTLTKGGCAATTTAPFTVCGASATGQVDDGSFGTGTMGPTHWVNRITPASYPATLTGVSFLLNNTWGPPVGSAITVIAAPHTAGGANIDGLSFQSTTTTTKANNVFNTYAIPPITISSGDFVVGFVLGGVFVPRDTTTPQNRSYTSSSTASFTADTGANLLIRAVYSTSCAAPTCVTVSNVAPGSGAPGDSVTITGTGFIGATSVRFGGGVAATFSVVSDTQISALVPPGAATGAITVSRPGCADALTTSLTVGAIACPAVSGVNPTLAAPGLPVTITGTGLSGVSVVKFSVDAAAAFSVASGTQIQATVPAGAEPGPITLSKAGCANAQSGSFTPCGTPLPLAADDGGAENASGGTDYTVVRLTPVAYPATLTTVTLRFDSFQNVPQGTPIVVVAGANADGNDVIDNTTFQTTASTVSVLGSSFTVTLGTPLTIPSGDFVLGYQLTAGQFKRLQDLTAPAGRTYSSSNGTTFTKITTANAIIRGTYTLDCPTGPPPSLSINNVTLAEGQSGSTNAAFSAALSAPSSQTVTVSYTTANGTATAGSDFTAASGTLTFAAGTTSQQILVPVLGDNIAEADETFSVTLSNPVNATLGTATGTGTITNDDLPGLSVGNVTAREGTNAVFTVTLAPAVAGPVTVNYATANGTATAGSDYTSASGQLSFAANETSRTVSVALLADAAVEGVETFTLTLSGAVGAPIASAQATGTIQDGVGVVGDLGGDGKTDIMWRKIGAGVDKGAMFLWTMSGTGLTGARYLDPISEDWQVQFTGDFNGDGKADVLWRNFNAASADAGKLYIWIMDGPNVVGGTGYTNSQADLGWRVDGVGDLNGDGKSDIVWRKTGAGVDKGAMFLWTMDGASIIGARYLDPISEDWQVVDVGDFNGDGKGDVLWRNFNPAAPDVGKLYIWIMDGPNVVAGTGYTAAQADLGWRVDGVGDLNGDGKADIVWRQTAVNAVDRGALFLWTMNGTGLSASRYLDPISEDWQVQGLGDFNGDGKTDVLWRNQGPGGDVGKLYVWIMDGPNVVAGTGYTAAQADLGWRVDSPRK
jgi:hypothetical protein